VIQSLDDTLFHLLAKGMTTLGSAPPTASQIRFQPPNHEWRQHVSSLALRKALNLYLVDLRENRKLRSTELFREYDAATGTITETPSPTRVDCHYLITAWSNATENLADPEHGHHGKTGEEHAILHEVASLLNMHQPLVPADVFGGAFPPGFDLDLRNVTLPTLLLPVDGFPKFAEFWGTMTDVHPWKPAIYYVVTLPLRVPTHPFGPPVTTLFADYREDWSEDGDLLIDFGGTVLDKHGVAASGAWVRLEAVVPPGRLVRAATTDDDGHFLFTRVLAQAYLLRAGLTGVGTAGAPIDVPAPSGLYDLQLT
jgi:hypothetical protein